MTKYIIPFLPVLFFLIISCNNKQVKNDSNADSIAPAVNLKQVDTARLKPADHKPDTVPSTSNTPSFISKYNLKTTDYIQQYPANQKAELISYMERLRKEWQDVPNPVTAVYQGNDFRDYHHIIFKAANGTTYDFGQAKNNYGPYQLHQSSGQYEDNPALVGKAFTIYREWNPAEFLCCNGEYGKTRAYLPAITKLALIKH